MALHSKVRYEVKLNGKTKSEQLKEVDEFGEDLYEAMYEFLYTVESPSRCVSQKFARFVSLTFRFGDLTDEDVYQTLKRLSDRRKKQ